MPVGGKIYGMEWLSSVIGIAARSIVGIVLTPVLSSIGMLFGRILYDFSGAISFSPLFWSLMAGVGVGAGIGGQIAWLTEMNNARPKGFSVCGFVIVVGVGLGAAVAGYEVGKVQEPTRLFTTALAQPMAYSILLSTVAVNATGILLALASGVLWRLPRPPVDNEKNQLGMTPK
jgi:hypothetical protein